MDYYRNENPLENLNRRRPVDDYPSKLKPQYVYEKILIKTGVGI